MIKNIILLGLLSWLSFSYAKHPVVQDSIVEAEAYKVEKPVEEQEAQRSVAGEKIKKKSRQHEKEEKSIKVDPNSDVRYWQYSE